MQQSIVFKREVVIQASATLRRLFWVLHFLMFAAIAKSAMLPLEKSVWVSILALHAYRMSQRFSRDYPKFLRVAAGDCYLYKEEEWVLVEEPRLVFQSNFFCALQCLIHGKRKIIPIFVDAMSTEDYHYIAYVLNQKN